MHLVSVTTSRVPARASPTTVLEMFMIVYFIFCALATGELDVFAFCVRYPACLRPAWYQHGGTGYEEYETRRGKVCKSGPPKKETIFLCSTRCDLVKHVRKGM